LQSSMFTNYPTEFADGSVLQDNYFPFWGTCPVPDTTPPTITTIDVFTTIDEGAILLGSVSANETVTWSVSTGVSIDAQGVLTLDAAAVFGTTYTFTVTATDTAGNAATTNAFSVTIISTNADLSDLIITSGRIRLDPIFASGTISYTTSVTNAKTSITVTPTQSDANATIQVSVNDGDYTNISNAVASGDIGLEEGSNTLEIKVTAQDGSTIKTYTITITRGLVPTITNFNDTIKNYFDASYTIVTPTTNSTGAFTYTSSNEAVATISEATVTIVGEGISTITATQEGDATYNSGSISHVLTVIDVPVLSKNGGISLTNPNYVNKNGAVNTSFGLSTTGAIIRAKTKITSAIVTNSVENISDTSVDITFRLTKINPSSFVNAIGVIVSLERNTTNVVFVQGYLALNTLFTAHITELNNTPLVPETTYYVRSFVYEKPSANSIEPYSFIFGNEIEFKTLPSIMRPPPRPE